MKISIQTVGKRTELELPADVSVAALRCAAAEAGGLAPGRTKLVCGGRVLLDEDGPALLAEGAKVFALSAPEAPPPRADGGAADAAEEDAVAALRLSRLTLSPLVRRLAQRLVARGAPEPVLALLLSVRRRMWLALAAWGLASRAAAARDIGAPFILATGFALLFLNLGKRHAGEASAYSVFNAGFARLPGAAAPEEIDRQLRAGQMM